MALAPDAHEITWSAELMRMSASIGICIAPVEGRSRDELVDAADGAMYRAKAGGPGRYVIAD